MRWHIDHISFRPCGICFGAAFAAVGLVLHLTPGSGAFAATPPKDVEDLKAWASEWRESRDRGAPVPKFVRRMALIEVGAKAQFLPVMPGDFSSQSFVEITDPWEGLLAFELNAHKIEPGNDESVSRAAFELLGVDAVVLARSGDGGASEWSMVTNADGEFRSRKIAGPPKEKKPASGIIAPSDLAAWIHRELGYHAVIVDAKGPYMLATGAPGAIAQGRQGIVRTKSASLISLSEGATGLGGIAEVVESSGNFAVLRMVIGGKSNADPRERIGLKVVFPDKHKASNRR